MLVKANKPDILEELAGYGSVYYTTEWRKAVETTMSNTGKIKVILRGPDAGSVRFLVNGVIKGTDYSFSAGKDEVITFNYFINKGDTLELQVKSSSSGGSFYLSKLIVSAIIYTMNRTYLEIEHYEVKSIGQFITAFLGGMNSEGIYVGGYMTSTSTSATTGNITLGKAVGYITVNLNGEIVKIPYYGE